MSNLLEYLKARLKNKALWISLIAFIPMLLQGLDVYNIHVVLPNNYGDIANAILGLLVLLGVINDPTTTNTWYHDDKEDTSGGK